MKRETPPEGGEARLGRVLGVRLSSLGSLSRWYVVLKVRDGERQEGFRNSACHLENEQRASLEEGEPTSRVRDVVAGRGC